jgi:hypothetical protein
MLRPVPGMVGPGSCLWSKALLRQVRFPLLGHSLAEACNGRGVVWEQWVALVGVECAVACLGDLGAIAEAGEVASGGAVISWGLHTQGSGVGAACVECAEA